MIHSIVRALEHPDLALWIIIALIAITIILENL